jgi:hypothetical protein
MVGLSGSRKRWSPIARLLRHPDFWILLAGLAFFVALAAKGRFHQPDFGAYYGAAGRFLAGQPLYFITEPAPFVPYLYAPVVALLFAPFRLLALAQAAVLWFACNVLLLVALRRLLARLSGTFGGARLALFFAAIGFAIEREWNVGNVNLLTLVVCLMAVALAARQSWAGAGGALALGIAIKPPSGLLALSLETRHPRAIVPLAITGAALLAAPLPFYGIAGTRALYGEFLRSIVDFQHRFGDSFKYASTTAGLLDHAMGHRGPDFHPHALTTILGITLPLVTMLAAQLRHRDTPVTSYVALALAPLTALSDYQVFMFAAPLAYYLIREWDRGRWPWARRLALAVALILFGGNWHDLWGDRLSKLWFDYGVQGIGTWGLIVLALLSPCSVSPNPGVHPG